MHFCFLFCWTVNFFLMYEFLSLSDFFSCSLGHCCPASANCKHTAWDIKKKYYLIQKEQLFLFWNFCFHFMKTLFQAYFFLWFPSPSPVFLIRICLHIIVLPYMIGITGNFSVLKPYIFVYALVWKSQEQWIRDKPLCCVKWTKIII